MKLNNLFEDMDDFTISNYLKKIGIESDSKYLKFSTIEPDKNYSSKINEAINLLNKYKESNGEIKIIVDCDEDGYSSASMLYSALVELGYNNLSYEVHDKYPKAHGLNDSEIMGNLKKHEPCLLIIPDASTSDVNAHKKLYELGYEIIVLDHHEAKENVDINDSPAIIINNQLIDTVNNKDGSGTTVTWHFIHSIDSKIANKYRCYVAISLLSDSMDCRSLENGTFIRWGLSEDKIHDNLKTIVSELNKSYAPYDYSFGCIPKTNATIRCGTLEEKRLLFDVMAGIETDEDKIKECVKNMKRCHSFQSKESKRLAEEEVVIDDVNAKVLICNIAEKSPFTGLVANRLMSQYNKPILLTHNKDDGNSDGSGRSPVEIIDRLNECPYFNYAQGHPCAMGVSYKLEYLEQIKEYLEKLELPVPTIDVLTTYNKNATPDVHLIDTLNNYDWLWTASGSKVTKPYFGFNMKIKREDIMFIGRSGTTMKFHIGDWDFIKFFCSNKWKEETFEGISDKSMLNITLIGTPQWNEYMGNKTPQIVIEKIEIEEDTTDIDDLFS